MNPILKRLYAGMLIFCLYGCASPWPQELNGTTLEPINKPATVADIENGKTQPKDKEKK